VLPTVRQHQSHRANDEFANYELWDKGNLDASVAKTNEMLEFEYTGSRMIVRFFGGWDFVAQDVNNRMPANVGYAKGVPMGGDLQATAANGKSPSFLVAALKDPIGANLDRIQIIKGWLDKAGNVQEKIYDLAVSDGRKIGADGRCKTAVGNTVDVPNASWTNTIGDPELIVVWKDPDFDASLRAFYYVRVIEIPNRK
jgi:hypothetical protein